MTKKNSWNKEYERNVVVIKEDNKERKIVQNILSKPGIKPGKLEQKFSFKVKYMPTIKKLKEENHEDKK